MTRRSPKSFSGMILAVALSASVPALQASAEGNSRLELVIERDRLIVTTSDSAPPFCFTDDKGQLVGFDIDIAKAIAKELLGDDAKIQFLPVSSEGRWPSVLSGRADFGIAGTIVYPDRAARVAFSTPYLDSGISIMVRRDAGIATLQTLNDPKYTVATLSNPQMADRMKQLLPKATVLTLDSPSAMFLAVKSGQAQAMQMDTPMLDWFAKDHHEMLILPEGFSSNQHDAIFMKPGDFAFWLYISTVIQEMRSGSRSAIYAAIYKKWFGKEPPTVSRTAG